MNTKDRFRNFHLVRAGLLGLAATASLLAQTATLTTLDDFTGSDGSYPSAGVVVGPGGILYGTTNGLGIGIGSVYSLTPPASPGGAWTENVLYTFAPGTGPYAGVVIGGGGVLYGTTPNGGAGPCTGGCGTVFSLTPPASSAGAWTATVLHNFGAGADGANPSGGVVIGEGGVLYGTTQGSETTGAGTVFSLTPPQSTGGSWTKRTLHTFGNYASYDGYDPIAGVVIGGGGVLYGTTYTGGYDNTGTVFSLIPPASPGEAWTENQIYSFQNGNDGAFPYAPVAIGADGVLYGTTASGGTTHANGTVFSMTPPTSPGGAWTPAIIHDFVGKIDGGGGDGSDPRSGVTIGRYGVLYGTTFSGGNGPSDNGTVYSLTPPSSPGGSWTETVLYDFPPVGGGIGAGPYGGVVFGAGEVLYGTTQAGGTSNVGTVFSLTP